MLGQYSFPFPKAALVFFCALPPLKFQCKEEFSHPSQGTSTGTILFIYLFFQQKANLQIASTEPFPGYPGHLSLLDHEMQLLF